MHLCELLNRIRQAVDRERAEHQQQIPAVTACREDCPDECRRPHAIRMGKRIGLRDTREAGDVAHINTRVPQCRANSIDVANRRVCKCLSCEFVGLRRRMSRRLSVGGLGQPIAPPRDLLVHRIASVELIRIFVVRCELQPKSSVIVMRAFLFLAICVVSITSVIAAAPVHDGSLDISYGSFGVSFQPFPGNVSIAGGAITEPTLQPDGKLLLVFFKTPGAGASNGFWRDPLADRRSDRHKLRQQRRGYCLLRPCRKQR